VPAPAFGSHSERVAQVRAASAPSLQADKRQRLERATAVVGGLIVNDLDLCAHSAWHKLLLARGEADRRRSSVHQEVLLHDGCVSEELYAHIVSKRRIKLPGELENYVVSCRHCDFVFKYFPSITSACFNCDRICGAPATSYFF
jgi:hypothetical protein